MRRVVVAKRVMYVSGRFMVAFEVKTSRLVRLR